MGQYEQKIPEIKEKIVKEIQPEKIVLFGSYAWGTPNEDSDMDLFVVKETDNTRITARKIDSSIFPRPFPIDFIVYTPSQLERAWLGRTLRFKNGVRRENFIRKPMKEENRKIITKN